MIMLLVLLQPVGTLDLALGVDHSTRILADERASAFELGRAELGAQLRWDFAGTRRAEGGEAGRDAFVTAEARFETVRSAQPQSLFGVDGNSLVVRARRVRIGAELPLGPLVFTGQAGLLADAFLEGLEKGDDLRDFTALSAQERGLLDQADLGARLRISVGQDRLAVQAGFANGEGATEGERNDGLDVTVLAEGAPWRGEVFEAPAEVRLLGFWRDGSRGAGAVKNDRLGAAATARAGRGSVGLAFVRADGFAERTEREVSDLELWINATVLPGWLGLLGRYVRTDLDQSANDAIRQQISAGLYLEPALSKSSADQRLRLYLSWSRLSHGADASPVAGVPEAVDQDVILLRLALTRAFEIGEKH